MFIVLTRMGQEYVSRKINNQVKTLKGKVSKSVGNRSKELLFFDCVYPILIAKKHKGDELS
jgi:hypothetical protein